MSWSAFCYNRNSCIIRANDARWRDKGTSEWCGGKQWGRKDLFHRRDQDQGDGHWWNLRSLLVYSITRSRKKAKKTSGVYCLKTNRNDLNEQQIWDIYTMLTDIEDGFRCMKPELGLRPIYHHIERRCDGHIFMTLLAYHVLHTLRFKSRQFVLNFHQRSGYPQPWSKKMARPSISGNLQERSYPIGQSTMHWIYPPNQDDWYLWVLIDHYTIRQGFNQCQGNFDSIVNFFQFRQIIHHQKD